MQYPALSHTAIHSFEMKTLANQRDFLGPTCSKIDLQVEFRSIFYIVLDRFDPLVSLVTSELPENIKLSTNRPKNFRNQGPMDGHATLMSLMH